MKICAIICEFNPFHNGHKYLIGRVREASGCDAVLCIMSGSFTQRGEMCILDKYARARHAVLGGADCVIQLPAPFAVAPAEIFAQGAIKILSAIPEVTTLAFGCECGERKAFISAADMLIDESDEFKNLLTQNLETGKSYIKSYAEAFEKCGGDKSLVSNPNNILGLEYAKAVKRANANIDILPIKRVGADYSDGELKDNYSSASAIRQNLSKEKVKLNVPDFVYADLKNAFDNCEFKNFLKHCIFKADCGNLKRIYGCGEGLENRLKSLENEPFESIIQNATSQRYSSSRINRILCANALELYGDDTLRFLNGDLYIKPLAVKKERADEMLSALSKSSYPVITGTNGENLNSAARQCFEKDKYEYSVYKHITGTDKKDYMNII